VRRSTLVLIDGVDAQRPAHREKGSVTGGAPMGARAAETLSGLTNE
jgi:hypothetical protein